MFPQKTSLDCQSIIFSGQMDLLMPNYHYQSTEGNYVIFSAKQSHTRLWALGMELISVSWQSATGDLVINPVVAAVTFYQARDYFPSQRDHPLGWYQIILVGDSHDIFSTMNNWLETLLSANSAVVIRLVSSVCPSVCPVSALSFERLDLETHFW